MYLNPNCWCCLRRKFQAAKEFEGVAQPGFHSLCLWSSGMWTSHAIWSHCHWHSFSPTMMDCVLRPVSQRFLLSSMLSKWTQRENELSRGLRLQGAKSCLTLRKVGMVQQLTGKWPSVGRWAQHWFVCFQRRLLCYITQHYYKGVTLETRN